MNLREFLHMGGYGAYIWTCYGLTLLAVIWNIISARRELASEIQRAKRRLVTSNGGQQP